MSAGAGLAAFLFASGIVLVGPGSGRVVGTADPRPPDAPVAGQPAGTGEKAQRWAMTTQVAIMAECLDVGLSAGKKIERLTKGETNVLDDDATYWLPKMEPSPHQTVSVHGPCVS